MDGDDPGLRARLISRLGDPLLRYGLVLLVAQLVWRSVIALDSYFWQDDFRFLAEVNTGLTSDVALQRYNGHLMPCLLYTSDAADE